MKKTINCTPNSFKTLERIPNSWSQADYSALLKEMEYDSEEASTEELEELCLLSLTDFEKEEAAQKVLRYVFKSHLNEGQIQNLSHEMQEEKVWEEYADIQLHEQFFNVGEILYKAFNGQGFPMAKAIEILVTFSSEKEPLPKKLRDADPSVILKLLAQGLPNNAIINRLYTDQLQQEVISEADAILWQIHLLDSQEKSIQLKIISSQYWLEDFKFTEPYTALLNIT
ncbi:magnesium and cobalt transport protein CorA [Cochleicola gelatinilyticus]|uniref:Uncharacterized protein n=1 Tax=Cochleicola gelatinilyticus TaxID=1763537 RepID=A0A167HID3_9FLAO|nr:hypothetical protein [Cochleicola gelatinilyticus]OAB78640.1 hypothetical protein ULVI_08620 [Cochleicola gelatinilyticus]